MIVVDSSALLAICFEEAEHASFVDMILSIDDVRIGAPNFVEASPLSTPAITLQRAMLSVAMAKVGTGQR